MRYYLYIFVALILLINCKQTPVNNTNIQNNFSFSPNKIWAHRVNSFKDIEEKHLIFEGLEVDLIYSTDINNFYIAHHDKDTFLGILLEDWIKHIPNPEKNWYWFDLKNLNKKNAEACALLLVKILNRYEVFHKTICESKDVKALAILKREGLAVSYWINSDVTFRKITGNYIWKKRIEKKIAFLKPNALSSFDWMYPLLATSFPDENILYWQSTLDHKTLESVELTRELCRIPNVKIVLVDYDEPVSY
jgi:heptose-I-phosphate ethanolaminephosphotransferase